ncbi:protein BatD [candidate division WOR-3 bacterium]|nr:protein BatD [candidate division WOR-3 bacterium]
MKIKNTIILYLLLSISFIVVDLSAQEINFSATIDRNVISPGESVTLTVIVSGNIAKVPKPKLPKLDEFNIYSQGSSRNISFVNGKISSSITYTYSLVPKKIGKFTIGSCELIVKGKTFRTEPIEIEVTKETTKIQKVKGKSFTILPGGRLQRDVEDGVNIFIKTFVNKKTVYVGEELILTFKLHTTVNLIAQPQYIPPETKDFWKEDMGKEKQYRKVIDGRNYEIVELNYALFPLTTGELTISGAELNCVIDNFTGDPFSFGFRSGTKKKLESDPITINVLPLPPTPDGFSGAVGDFKIFTKLDKKKVEQNEPITVITTIEGDGNLRDIEDPEIKMLVFRIYESGSEVKTFETSGKLIEKKVVKTMIIPNRSGDFEIPEISFTFFNPRKKQYITKQTNKLLFTVLPGDGKIGRFLGKGDVEVIGKDIHFIKTMDRLTNQGNPLGEIKYFLLANFLLLGAFLWIFISVGVKERMKLKEEVVRKRRALNCAIKNVGKAEREAKKGEKKKAYEFLHIAILQFFADKFNLSVWGTTEDEIKYRLREVGISDEISKEVSLLLDACNRARFSKEEPSGEQFKKYIKRTIKLLKNLRI